MDYLLLSPSMSTKKDILLAAQKYAALADNDDPEIFMKAVWKDLCDNKKLIWDEHSTEILTLDDLRGTFDQFHLEDDYDSFDDYVDEYIGHSDGDYLKADACKPGDSFNDAYYGFFVDVFNILDVPDFAEYAKEMWDNI